MHDIVVYDQQRRQPRSVIQPYTRSKSNIDEVVKQLDEPKAEVKQLTDKDGLDRSYDAENDISIIDNTIYIAGTHSGRASDWYYDSFKVPSLWAVVPLVNQYKSFMLGMKAVPYIGDLARKANLAFP